jgi:hypothetical protein
LKDPQLTSKESKKLLDLIPCLLDRNLSAEELYLPYSVIAGLEASKPRPTKTVDDFTIQKQGPRELVEEDKALSDAGNEAANDVDLSICSEMSEQTPGNRKESMFNSIFDILKQLTLRNSKVHTDMLHLLPVLSQLFDDQYKSKVYSFIQHLLTFNDNREQILQCRALRCFLVREYVLEAPHGTPAATGHRKSSFAVVKGLLQQLILLGSASDNMMRDVSVAFLALTSLANSGAGLPVHLESFWNQAVEEDRQAISMFKTKYYLQMVFTDFFDSL